MSRERGPCVSCERRLPAQDDGAITATNLLHRVSACSYERHPAIGDEDRPKEGAARRPERHLACHSTVHAPLGGVGGFRTKAMGVADEPLGTIRSGGTPTRR